MQIPHGKPGPRQVLVVNGPSEVEEHSAAGPVLKIRVFLAIENRLLRDTLAHMLRRLGDVEVSGKSGGGETNPEEVAKSSSDVALLNFLDPGWMSVVRSKAKRRGARSRP